MTEMRVYGPENDGVDRRGFLKCMAWVGTGVVWTMTGGVLGCRPIGADTHPADQDGGAAGRGDFTFVQISDSHIGFAKEPNKDVTGSLRLAVDRINALPDPDERDALAAQRVMGMGDRDRFRS